jgi:hypothetical protein
VERTAAAGGSEGDGRTAARPVVDSGHVNARGREEIGLVVLGEELRESLEIELRAGRRESRPRGLDAHTAPRVIAGTEAPFGEHVQAASEGELRDVRAVRDGREHGARVGVDEMEAVVT